MNEQNGHGLRAFLPWQEKKLLGFVHNPHITLTQYASYMSRAESPGELLKNTDVQVPPSKSDAVGLNDPNICLSFQSSLENSDALAGLRTIKSCSTYRYRNNYLWKEDRRSFHQHPDYFLIFGKSALFGEWGSIVIKYVPQKKVSSGAFSHLSKY